jgi:hypothetical protein
MGPTFRVIALIIKGVKTPKLAAGNVKAKAIPDASHYGNKRLAPQK